MKIYLVGPVLAWREKGIDAFHTGMFHGKLVPDRNKNLQMIRSGLCMPDIMCPHHIWIVSEAVRKKIEHLPNIAFEPMRFKKLVDWPVRPGDNSHYRHGVFFQEAEKVMKGLPDVKELHRRARKYFFAGFPDRFALEDIYPSARTVALRKFRFTAKFHMLGSEDDDVLLSARMMRENPVVDQEYLVMGEEVYALLEPHFDWDFFQCGTLELKR